jgi:hypothetical protein
LHEFNPFLPILLLKFTAKFATIPSRKT